MPAAQFLLGKIESVCAEAGIVVKKRQKIDSDEWGEVETDDYCNFIADIEGDIKGTFSITRCAIGNANTIKYDIYGTEGVISFNLNDSKILGICLGEIDKEAKGLHFVDVPGKYFTTQEQTFVDLVKGKFDETLPTIKDGAECQKILDALLRSSEERRWIDID